MKKKLLFVIPLSLFVLDYLLIYFQIIQPLDWMIYHLVQNLRCDFMTSFFKLCSTLGSTWFYVLLVVVLMFLKDKKELLIGIHLLIGQGINIFTVEKAKSELLNILLKDQDLLKDYI